MSVIYFLNHLGNKQNSQVNDILSLVSSTVIVVATPGRLLALCGVESSRGGGGAPKPSEALFPPTPPAAAQTGAFELPSWLSPPAPTTSNDAMPPPAPAATMHESFDDIDKDSMEVCLSLSSVSMLVLDEADEMIKGGFGKDLESIGKLIPTSASLLTFSATWNSRNHNPADIVWPNTDNRPVKVIIDESCVKANTKDASRVPATVKQVVEVLNGTGKGAHRLHRMVELLFSVLKSKGNAMVFVMHKAEAVQVARDLNKALGEGTCAALQGDMSSHARNEVMESFRSGECRILVCTDVAARGIDVQVGVSFVLNASIGMTIENYVHRCGRTGRPPLNKGTAHTFVIKDDEKLTPDLVNILQASKAPVPEELRELAARAKQKALKAEKRQQAVASGGGGGGATGGGAAADEDEDDEKRELLEQRIANREKQKAIQEKKMGSERKQQKGKGGGKGKKKKGH